MYKIKKGQRKAERYKTMTEILLELKEHELDELIRVVKEHYSEDTESKDYIICTLENAKEEA